MDTRTLKRALGTGVATAVVAAGLSLGTAPAQAAEPHRPVEALPLDLLGLDLGELLTAGPKLLGGGGVGSPLTLVAPVFGLLDPVTALLVDTDVTWLCDGEAIPGVGNVLTFVPTEAQAGCQIAARTVSTVLGLLPLSLVTNLVSVLTGDGGGDGTEPQLTATAGPRITGTGRVGGLLQVEPGSWAGGPGDPGDAVTPAFSYQWYNASGPIPGATGRQYAPRPGDAGRPVAALVTATLEGFLDGVAVTDVAPVARVGSRTRLARAGRLLKVVVAPKGAAPTGKVRLVSGGKTLRTFRLRAADGGGRLVRLPRLRKGVHRVTAVYAGSSSLQRSRSQPLRVRVR